MKVMVCACKNSDAAGAILDNPSATFKTCFRKQRRMLQNVIGVDSELRNIRTAVSDPRAMCVNYGGQFHMKKNVHSQSI